MDISFYTAKVSAWQQQERLKVHGNNISNVNTFGFRAKRPSFSALMTGPVQGITEDLARGVGAHMVTAETDFTSKSIRDTGLPYDYAINGYGFFALYDPQSGEYSFTRDGSFTKQDFQVWENVLDELGEPVLDENGQPQRQQVTKWYLSDGVGRFVVGTDGQWVEVTNDIDALPVGIFDFENYNGVQLNAQNNFTPVAKNGDLMVGTGTLLHGYVEDSNTDIAYEFVKVIEAQHTFTYSLRMIQTSDEITNTVNNLR